MEQRREAVKRSISGILALFAVILYATGFEICEYFYYDDIDKWRSLRDTLTGLNIFLLVILNFLPTTRLKISSLWAFGVFCFGNVVDRLIFDIDQFVYSDWFVIGIATIIFIHKMRCNGYLKKYIRY